MKTLSSVLQASRPGTASRIGWSSISNHEECPYRWALAELVPHPKGGSGIKGGEARAPFIGSRFHDAAAGWYTFAATSGRYEIDAGMEALRKGGSVLVESVGNDEDWAQWMGEAEELWVRYAKECGDGGPDPDRERFQVASDEQGPLVEREFEVDLGYAGYYYTTRMDCVGWDGDGQLIYVEHKCVTGGSRVFDYATGRLRTVRDLAAEGAKPSLLAWAATTGGVSAAGTQGFVPVGERDVYRVRTKTGRVLRVSSNHPILTATGWVEAQNLEPGNRVAIPKSTGTNGYIDEGLFTDAEVKFLGYMLGDGSMNTLTFAQSDGAVLNDFLVTIEDMGYVEKRTTEREDITTGYRVLRTEERVPRVWLSNHAKSHARILLERLGLRECRSAQKSIPDELHSISDRQVGLLLGALWSTDGYVGLTYEGPQAKIAICYTSVSYALCQSIQRLLLRFGVMASLTESSVEYKGARRQTFCTKVIGRESKRKFLELCESGAFPVIRTKALVSATLQAIKPGHHKREVCKSAVADEGIFWDKVDSVFVDGFEMMYDITVPHYHNFVVDDIITHNTHDVSRRAAELAGYQIDPQISGGVLALHGAFGATLQAPPQAVVNCVWKRAAAKSPCRTWEPLERTELDLQKFKLDMIRKLKRMDESVAEYKDLLAKGVEPLRAIYLVFDGTRKKSTCADQGRKCSFYDACYRRSTVRNWLAGTDPKYPILDVDNNNSPANV